MIHRLKTETEYFRAVRSGAKAFEVRKNDRNFQTWDMLELFEIDENGDATGEEILVFITYVLVSEECLQPGYACLGISLQNKWHRMKNFPVVSVQ